MTTDNMPSLRRVLDILQNQDIDLNGTINSEPKPIFVDFAFVPRSGMHVEPLTSARIASLPVMGDDSKRSPR